MLADALNTYNNETRTLRYVLMLQARSEAFPIRAMRISSATTTITTASSTQPEFRKIGILAITPDTLKDHSTTDADIKTAFEAKKDKLGASEKRIIQQISFTSSVITPSSKIQSARLRRRQGAGPERRRYRPGTLARADLAGSDHRRSCFHARAEQGQRAGHRQARKRRAAARDGGPGRQHPNL